MDKTNRLFLRRIILLGAVIFAVSMLPSIAREYAPPVTNKIMNNIHTYFFIGLFSAWGVSIDKRVVQKQARRYLILVSYLTVFWLTVREMRFRIVIDETARRYLWYCYYIAILLIPLIAFFVLLSLKKGENYRLPKTAMLASVPTVLLLLAVLTNEYHQLVFTFPEGAKMTSEVDYSYGSLYYVLTAWVFLLSAASFITMLTKSRNPKSRKLSWLPILPFPIAMLYFALYALRVRFILDYFGDITVIWCLVFTGYFEACIRSGLIQSNMRYFDLFSASKGASIQITDNDYNVRYSAKSAEKISAEDMRRAENAPVILPDKKRLRNMPVNGGRAVWTEDISQLFDLKKKLNEQGEELEERNALLQFEYEKEREHKTALEQNRLYDLLQSKTQKQLDSIDALVQEYKTETDAKKKQTILAKIAVLGSFIKRRKNFVLSNEVDGSMLERALCESARSLKLLGIKCVCFVDLDGAADTDTLTKAYDFFEAVVEAVFDKAHYINVRVGTVGGSVRINIFVDCGVDLNSLSSEFGEPVVDTDDGTTLVLTLKKGGEAV